MSNNTDTETKRKRGGIYKPDAVCHLPKGDDKRRQIKQTGNIQYYDTRGKYITLINTAIKTHKIIEKPNYKALTPDELEKLATRVKELVVLKRMEDLKNNRH
jgi:hypothetical protein